MDITLQQFRDISNGLHNVGQMRVNAEGTGLERVNNHVWKTSENNVLLTAKENIRVRQALLTALSPTCGTDQRRADLANVLFGGGRAAASLQRDFVKRLIRAVDSGEDLAAVMPAVTKSLSERSLVRRSEHVTSGMDIAQTKHVTEEMDGEFLKAHAGMAVIGTIRCHGDATAEKSKMAEGVVKVLSGVIGAAQLDTRLTEQQREEIARLRDVTEQTFHSLTPMLSDPRGVVEIRRHLRQMIVDAFTKAGVDREITESYLVRISTGPRSLGRRDAKIRQLITALRALAPDAVLGNDLSTFLFEQRAQFLVWMQDAVKDDISMPAEYRRTVIANLAEIGKGEGVDEGRRGRLLAFQRMINEHRGAHPNDPNLLNEDFVTSVLQFMADDLREAFRTIPAFSDRANDYLGLAGL